MKKSRWPIVENAANNAAQLFEDSGLRIAILGSRPVTSSTGVTEVEINLTAHKKWHKAFLPSISNANLNIWAGSTSTKAFVYANILYYFRTRKKVPVSVDDLGIEYVPDYSPMAGSKRDLSFVTLELRAIRTCQRLRKMWEITPENYSALVNASVAVDFAYRDFYHCPNS